MFFCGPFCPFQPSFHTLWTKQHKCTVDANEMPISISQRQCQSTVCQRLAFHASQNFHKLQKCFALTAKMHFVEKTDSPFLLIAFHGWICLRLQKSHESEQSQSSCTFQKMMEMSKWLEKHTFLQIQCFQNQIHWQQFWISISFHWELGHFECPTFGNFQQKHWFWMVCNDSFKFWRATAQFSLFVGT